MKALLLALVSCLMVSQATADSWIRFVRVKVLHGIVVIDRAQSPGSRWNLPQFVKAVPNMPVTEGVSLKTGAEAGAVVEFEDHSSVSLEPNTLVRFPELMLLSSGDRSSRVEVLKGGVFLKFRNKGHDQFTISLAGKELRLDRSVELRAQVNGDRVQISVLKGAIAIPEIDGDVMLGKNQSLSFEARPGAQVAVQHF